MHNDEINYSKRKMIKKMISSRLESKFIHKDKERQLTFLKNINRLGPTLQPITRGKKLMKQKINSVFERH